MKRKEKVSLFSDHNGSLQRRQPGVHGMHSMVSWVSSIFTGMPSELSELNVLSKSELGMALIHSLMGRSIKILAPSSV